VSEVVDKIFIPITPSEITLLQEKQKYMYAVLESKVLTHRGMTFVHEYYYVLNTQKIYHKRNKNHLESTEATIKFSVIRSYITPARFCE
jgi:hypothetical protein